MTLRHFIKHLRCNTSLFRSSSLHYLSSAPSSGPHRHQQLQQDPYELLKEDPIQICTDIWVKSFTAPRTKPFSNLTGFLSKFDIWVLAYQRSFAHFTGSSFPSRNSLPSEVLRALLSLRNAVVKGHFQWNLRTQWYIHSPNDKPMFDNQFNSKKNTAHKLLFQDRLVQEVVLLILEPIFEARFSSKSHGFRPGRNAHTVIRTIRSNFARYVWYLRGDLSEVLDNVDRGVVMSCLHKVVKDRKVLGLINSAFRQSRYTYDDCELRLGGGLNKKKKMGGGSKRRKVLDPNEPKPDPYWLRTFFDFAPKEAEKVPNYGDCGILSPLLANVCLNELDQMMEGKLRTNLINDACHNPAWPEFVPSGGGERTRKMDYIRYGAHFLIGIRGTREDAVEMRKELIEFCKCELGVQLDNMNVEIEHVSRGVEFLDHVISHRVIYPTLHYTATGGKTFSRKGVGTLLSVTASLSKCIRQFRRLELLKGDKDPEPLPCTPMLYSSQAHTNAQMNKFLETMADWYKYADNRKKVIGFFAYVIRSSLAKLYAARYKLKSRAKVYNIASRDLSHSLNRKAKRGASEHSDLVRLGLVDPIEGVQFSHMSSIPSCDYTPFPRDWIPEHEQVLMEYIQLQDPKYYCELLRSIKTGGLNLPQSEISEIVWDFKTLGIRRFDIEREKNVSLDKLRNWQGCF